MKIEDAIKILEAIKSEHRNTPDQGGCSLLIFDMDQ